MAIDFGWSELSIFCSKILWMGIVWWLWGYGAEINWNMCFELSYPCNSLFSIWTCFWPLRFVNLNKLLKDKMFCVVYGKTRLHFHGDLICYVIIYIYIYIYIWWIWSLAFMIKYKTMFLINLMFVHVIKRIFIFCFKNVNKYGDQVESIWLSF